MAGQDKNAGADNAAGAEQKYACERKRPPQPRLPRFRAVFACLCFGLQDRNRLTSPNISHSHDPPWPMIDTGRLQIVYPAPARSQNFFGRMTQKSCVTKLRNLGQRFGTVCARTPAEPRRTPEMWRSTCCSSDACALCPTGHEDLLEIRRVFSFNATSLLRPTMEPPACEPACRRAGSR